VLTVTKDNSLTQKKLRTMSGACKTPLPSEIFYYKLSSLSRVKIRAKIIRGGKNSFNYLWSYPFYFQKEFIKANTPSLKFYAIIWF